MDYEPRHDVVFLNARPSSPRTLFLIHDPHIFGGTDTITTSTQSTNPIIAIHHHCHCHCLVIHRCVSLLYLCAWSPRPFPHHPIPNASLTFFCDLTCDPFFLVDIRQCLFGDIPIEVRLTVFIPVLACLPLP